MHHVGCVKEVDRAEEIIEYNFGVLVVKRNLLVLVKDLGQILIDMAHDEENTSRLAITILFFWNNDVKKLDCEDVVLH